VIGRSEITRSLFHAWGRILQGYRPNLSIEITRECPLRCPGCYAYGEGHLGGDITLRKLSDYQGDELVRRVLDLVDRRKPNHVSIVGGEPLVRFRELGRILPALAERKIYSQVVTSAVRQIPREWADIPRLQVCVSIDGLPAEHNLRRAPATYDRVLKHIDGHQITVHCTVTPQIGEESEERLTPADRSHVIEELRRLRPRFSKLQLYDGMLEAYAHPPASPAECTFALTTECVSADLERRITPCQFGGKPDCANCGCLASAGLEAISRHRIAGGVPIGRVLTASLHVGGMMSRLRPSVP